MDTQTPRNKDIAHRRPKDSPASKSISDQSKKLHKLISRKNLNSKFASVSEESLNESVTYSLNSSPISQVSCDNNLIRGSSDSLESILTSENQSTFPSDEASKRIDVTPSSTITSINDETVNLSFGHSNEIRSNNSVEVDVVLNFLKQARNQVSSSSDISTSSKKYLDALVEAYMRDLCELPDEGDRSNALLSKRLQVVIICFVVWLIIVTAIIIRWSGTRRSFSFNATPT